jgi:flagellar M-ring protein FliF
VSRSTARIIEPVGGLNKVSVAILVDGRYELPPGAKPEARAKYLPRSPDEMQKIEALVKSAVGFNAERGDQVTVANIPFQETGEGGPEAEKWWEAPIVQALLKNGLIAMGFLALLLFVIRPLLKILRAEPKPVSFLPLQTDLEAAQLIEAHKRDNDKQKLTQLELVEKVKQDPYQVAQILQNWLVHKE